MPRKPKYRKPYPPEFRREAVARYAGTDRTLGEIASDLGVSRESLRLWVQQAQFERGERDGLPGDEREELREHTRFLVNMGGLRFCGRVGNLERAVEGAVIVGRNRRGPRLSIRRSARPGRC